MTKDTKFILGCSIMGASMIGALTVLLYWTGFISTTEILCSGSGICLLALLAGIVVLCD